MPAPTLPRPHGRAARLRAGPPGREPPRPRRAPARPSGCQPGTGRRARPEEEVQTEREWHRAGIRPSRQKDDERQATNWAAMLTFPKVAERWSPAVSHGSGRSPAYCSSPRTITTAAAAARAARGTARRSCVRRKYQNAARASITKVVRETSGSIAHSGPSRRQPTITRLPNTPQPGHVLSTKPGRPRLPQRKRSTRSQPDAIRPSRYHLTEVNWSRNRGDAARGTARNARKTRPSASAGPWRQGGESLIIGPRIARVGPAVAPRRGGSVRGRTGFAQSWVAHWRERKRPCTPPPCGSSRPGW